MTDLSPQEEQAAVEAAQRDPREFVRLYDAYADRVYRFLLSRTAHREMAEDLTQETFLKALAAIGRYRWRGVPFGAWLMTIARNSMISAVVGRRSAVDAAGEDIEEIPAPDSRLASRADASRAWSLAEELTDDQHQALALRYRADLPIAQIAATMGKSEAAVKMLLQRAVKSLAERMK